MPEGGIHATPETSEYLKKQGSGNGIIQGAISRISTGLKALSQDKQEAAIKTQKENPDSAGALSRSQQKLARRFGKMESTPEFQAAQQKFEEQKAASEEAANAPAPVSAADQRANAKREHDVKMADTKHANAIDLLNKKAELKKQIDDAAHQRRLELLNAKQQSNAVSPTEPAEPVKPSEATPRRTRGKGPVNPGTPKTDGMGSAFDSF
jgi:hypothetical protein